MVTILIIAEKDFVHIVALEGLLNFVNQVGEIDTDHLMVIRDFISNLIELNFILDC